MVTTAKEGEEVIEGSLQCQCGRSYPIIRGVPRILAGELLGNALREYGRKGEGQITKAQAYPQEAVEITKTRTMDAFGFEWRHYADYDAENYHEWMPEGVKPEKIFEGKIGLEVGCGAGRHAARTAQVAKTHYAVDLSYAVDAAFERTRAQPNCHVIQADAFNLPYQEGTFDYVYCLGVLQHMHDPPTGFAYLARQPRENGVLLVNVYQASRPFTMAVLEAIRKVTTRMPAGMLNGLCIVLGSFDYLMSQLWKTVDHFGLSRVLGLLVPQRTKEYARHNFKTITADWYDRLACPRKFHYSREELVGWYEKANYVGIRVTPYWKAFWNGIGTRQCRPPTHRSSL